MLIHLIFTNSLITPPQQYSHFADNKQQMHDRTLIQQAQLYDDLSSFIQVFKQIVLTTQNMSNYLTKGREFFQPLKSIDQITLDLKKLIDKYQGKSKCLNIQASTFNRFTYRLIEIISNCKIKYQKSPKKINQLKFLSLLNDLQTILRQQQYFGKLYKILLAIQMLLLKFTTNILFDESGRIKIANCNDCFLKIAQNMSVRYHKMKLNSDIYHSQSVFSTNEQNQIEIQALQLKNQKISITNQIYAGIQSRFSLFKGLDLDFSYFRGSFFQAKNENDHFLKEFMQRNKLILNSIEYYNEKYQKTRKNSSSKLITEQIQLQNYLKQYNNSSDVNLSQRISLHKRSINKKNPSKDSNQRKIQLLTNYNNKRNSKLTNSLHIKTGSFNSNNESSLTYKSQINKNQGESTIPRTLIRLRAQQKNQRNTQVKSKNKFQKIQYYLVPNIQFKIYEAAQSSCKTSSLKYENNQLKLQITNKISFKNTNKKQNPYLSSQK